MRTGSLIFLWLLVLGNLYAAPIPEFKIDNGIIAGHVPRLGVNLGEWTAWGAAQLSRNVLLNQGFEGNIDR